MNKLPLKIGSITTHKEFYSHYRGSATIASYPIGFNCRLTVSRVSLGKRPYFTESMVGFIVLLTHSSGVKKLLSFTHSNQKWPILTQRILNLSGYQLKK